MDKNLLTLWQTTPSGSVKQEELAEILCLSQKQTSRNIQKWIKEGWLKFTPGHGRGNLSVLEWLKNVEEIYEAKILHLIDIEPIETISKYLLFNWSSNSKLRLMNKFRTKLGFNQNTRHLDKLVIPRKYPFITTHPLKAADSHSASLVANVYNRLIFMDEHGFIKPEIAHSWDVSGSKLTLYLKKDIRFHDGSILVAEDVVTCLNRLKSHPYYKNLWEPVTEIVALAPLVVEINFPNGCSYILQMLGTMNASIYKESKENVFGSGCFSIEVNNEFKTSLFAFKDYFHERPLLDIVEFVQVPQDFDIAYRSSIQSEVDPTVQVESYSGFGVILMNAFRKSAIQRKDVRDYLHYVIAKKRNEISNVDTRYLANNDSCLIGQSQDYEIKEVECPHFTEPLVLRGVNYTKKTTLWLKDILEQAGVPIELKWISFEDTLNKQEKNEVDLFVHGEIFEMNQNFSFYFFLSNGFSPLVEIIKTDDILTNYLNEYSITPFNEWTTLNLKVEKALLESSMMIPLYYERRQIPFSADLMNIKIKHFGFVDFSKLWVRPNFS